MFHDTSKFQNLTNLIVLFSKYSSINLKFKISITLLRDRTLYYLFKFESRTIQTKYMFFFLEKTEYWLVIIPFSVL